MGAFDSTRTRVVPVFDELFGRDPSGDSWLNPLLSLPGRAPRNNLGLISPDFPRFYGSNERGLHPPMSLLRWLVRNPTEPSDGTDYGSGEAKQKRMKLITRDPATEQEAIRLLDKGYPGNAWYVLEGVTYPDVFIETNNSIIVIEGKRTERGPTVSTKWMRHRHQMLRHLDAAWELRGDRGLYGLLIVEGAQGQPELPARYIDYATQLVTAPVLDASLPHRSAKERAQIGEAFLGVTTWQHVQRLFGLRALP